jgi:hypothetical protein
MGAQTTDCGRLFVALRLDGRFEGSLAGLSESVFRFTCSWMRREQAQRRLSICSARPADTAPAANSSPRVVQ